MKLNELIFTLCPFDSYWAATAAHEAAHSMGLDHNVHRYSGNCTSSAAYSMLMVGGCPYVVTAPQTTDYNAFNAIYPNYLRQCATNASDFRCDGQDKGLQGCGDYPQTPATTGGPASVLVHWAGSGCQTNWISSTVSSGYTIYKIELKRSPHPDWSGPPIDYDIYDMPDAITTYWYTNMVWSPYEYAQGCVWYQSTSTWAVSGPVCTGWH